MKVNYLTLLILVPKLFCVQKPQIESKIPDTASFITTSGFNISTKVSFHVEMKEAAKSLVNKSQVDDALDIADKNREKLIKCQTFDLSFLNGKKYFDNDGPQNHLMFKPINDTVTRPVGDTERIILWRSKGLSEETVKLSTAPGSSLAPKLK